MKTKYLDSTGSFVKEVFPARLPHPPTPPTPTCTVVPPRIEQHLVYTFIIEMTNSVQSSDVEVIVGMSVLPQSHL